MRVVGLIGARKGSKRVPRKNLQEIDGVPLVAIAVREALESEVFERVICSSDDQEILEVASSFGAEPLLRPAELATATSSDVEWVNHAFRELGWRGEVLPAETLEGEQVRQEMTKDRVSQWVQDPLPDAFAILRPTSPFRTAETIRRAWTEFQQATGADSIRAVQPVKERPEKMWKVKARVMRPYLNQIPQYDDAWAYDKASQQSATFGQDLYVQNACIEIAWTKVLPRSISGERVAPFFAQGHEGHDINEPDDLEYARWLVETGKVKM